MVRILIAAVATLMALACDGSAPTTNSYGQQADFAPVARFPEAAAPSPVPIDPADRAQIKGMLYDAAIRQGVNPGLVMGVAWWESGWNQSMVSSAGAIGVMQVEPATAATAGPQLLGRPADPSILQDNIDLGTAILKEDLDRYGPQHLEKALVAYYAGPGAVKEWAQLDSNARAYVQGVYELAVAFDEGKGPA